MLPSIAERLLRGARKTLWQLGEAGTLHAGTGVNERAFADIQRYEVVITATLLNERGQIRAARDGKRGTL